MLAQWVNNSMTGSFGVVCTCIPGSVAGTLWTARVVQARVAVPAQHFLDFLPSLVAEGFFLTLTALLHSARGRK